MTPLAPQQKSVLRVRGVISAGPILILAIVADITLQREAGLPFGIALGAGLAVAGFLIFFTPPRRYKAWGYDAGEEELHVQSGIWVKSRTVVPYGRVQHIDVSQGPVERRYGVGTLTLHTAGTRGSAVSLPGLQMEDAERLRDEIRAQIRQDLV